MFVGGNVLDSVGEEEFPLIFGLIGLPLGYIPVTAEFIKLIVCSEGKLEDAVIFDLDA